MSLYIEKYAIYRARFWDFINYTLILWNHNIKEWVPKERICMIHFTCHKYISLDTHRILVYCTGNHVTGNSGRPLDNRKSS